MGHSPSNSYGEFFFCRHELRGMSKATMVRALGEGRTGFGMGACVLVWLACRGARAHLTLRALINIRIPSNGWLVRACKFRLRKFQRLLHR